MTRQEIESEYKVVNGVIKSPGKFEGEPVYAPYFWDMVMNGMADRESGPVASFMVEPEDIEQFPELTGHRYIRIEQSEQGFIYCS